METFLINHINILFILQLLGISLGVGSSIVYSFLHLKFLKDFKIDRPEHRKLNVISIINWVSIVILLLDNLGLYLANPLTYRNLNSLFIPFLILIMVLVCNALLTFYVNPKLIGVRIDLKSIHVSKTFWLRQKSFALGAVLLLSWCSILGFSYFRTPVSDDGVVMLSYYIVTIFIGFTISQIGAFLIDKNKK